VFLLSPHSFIGFVRLSETRSFQANITQLLTQLFPALCGARIPKKVNILAASDRRRAVRPWMFVRGVAPWAVFSANRYHQFAFYRHHLHQANHDTVTPMNRMPDCNADILYARWIL
jgi:hypothetical protein